MAAARGSRGPVPIAACGLAAGRRSASAAAVCRSADEHRAEPAGDARASAGAQLSAQPGGLVESFGEQRPGGVPVRHQVVGFVEQLKARPGSAAWVLVAAADHLAAAVGAATLDGGGNAADAAIAAAAVMAVTAPHMCGLGGDLFALVSVPGRPPAALNASGRAGSGAHPERLRASGARQMPFQRDVRSVTVTGCVDGLVALHTRYGSGQLGDLLSPALRLADAGFPVSATLAEASAELDRNEREAAFGDPAPLVPGRRLRLPGMARALQAIAATGRAGF